jgi:excisionase family DNA binding protein
MAISKEDQTPLAVTVGRACELSGLGPTTLWGLLKSGKLEAVRVGRRTLVTYRSLEALLAPRPEPAPRRRCRPRKMSAPELAP